jgi:hypothetical protein
MKKTLHLSLFSSLLLLSTACNRAQEKILLTAPGLEFIDGKSFGINKYVIANIRHIGIEIRKLQIGVKKKDESTTVGSYDYKSQLFTLKELVELEANSSVNERLDLQKALLEKAKTSISAITEPFMENANDIKEYMVTLIEESCKKRNRSDSLLLQWASQKKGTELEYFKSSLVSFAVIDLFCSDLLHFLDDLVYSCPKARKEYKEFVEKLHHKKVQ